MVDAVRRGFGKTLFAEIFDVTRKTVTKWCKLLEKLPEKPEKILADNGPHNSEWNGKRGVHLLTQEIPSVAERKNKRT